MQVKDLHQAETCVTEQRKACEDLKAELSATRHELSIMRSTHLNDTDNARKEISKLEDELQAARLHVNMVKSNLRNSLAKQAKAETTIQSLDADIEKLQKQLHAGTEQISGLLSDLQTKAAAYDALTAEYQSNVDKCQLLSTSVQQSEEQLQARSVEIEHALATVESERNIKARSPHDFQGLNNVPATIFWLCLMITVQQTELNMSVYRMVCHLSLNRKQRI